MKFKKDKLLSYILIPTTALCVAGGTTGLILALTLNKHSNVNPFLNGKTVTFSAGEGVFVDSCTKTTVESGTTFDRVDQPSVRSLNPKKAFAGWIDETGKPVYGRAQVKTDMKLRAIYNDVDDEHVTITFAVDPATNGPFLQGNINISVNKGYFFFMANRPSAKWIVTDGTSVKNKYFKGWKYADTGIEVHENDVIDHNVTLYPEFTESVNVTWDAYGFSDTEPGYEPPAGHGEVLRGQTVTSLSYGTPFNEFNQPALNYVYSGTHTNDAYFAGWYKDTAGTQPWDPSEPVTGDVTAHAKWSSDPGYGSSYGTITFQNPRSTDIHGEPLPEGMTFAYTPTTKMIVQLNEQRWSDVNKPTLVCYYTPESATKDYKVDHWEINNGTTEEPKWEELGEASTFSAKANYVRPVLCYAIDEVHVYGDSSIQLEETKQYHVLVTGGSASDPTQVLWQLTSDDAGEVALSEDIATVDSTGNVTVKSVSRTIWEVYGIDRFYVKATSILDPTKSGIFRVNLDMPYNNSSAVWIHTETSSPDSPKWYHANINDFCNTEATSIVATGIDGTTKEFKKTDPWVDTITFGSKLILIPDNFLSGWTNFNAKIDLKSSKIAEIGRNFLSGCTSFNSDISPLDKIQTVKSGFLSGCTSFDKNINFTSRGQLTSIDDDFLAGCSSFDSSITLPEFREFTIGKNFLSNCVLYNQPLVLPNIITSIDENFMSNCNAFTSLLTVECSLDNFSNSDKSLSSTSPTAPIAATGFEVDGSHEYDFKQNFFDLTGPEYFRTIKDSTWTGEVTQQEFNDGKAKLASAFNLTLKDQIYGTIFEYNASQTNPTSYSVCRKTVNEESTFVLREAALNNAEIEYDKDGNFLTSYGLANPYSPYSQLYTVQSLAMVEQTKPGGTWTLDTTNKWYAYEWTETQLGATYNLKAVIKFNRSTKDIGYVAAYSKESSSEEWLTSGSMYISNIGTTEEIKAPTEFKHKNIATWDTSGSKYKCSDALAVSDTQTSGFIFKIESSQFATLPSQFDAWLYETDESVPISTVFGSGATANLFHEDGTMGTVQAVFDTTTNKLRITCTKSGTFTANDIIVITFTGPLPANVNFVAQEVTA